jgi:MFS family permease
MRSAHPGWTVTALGTAQTLSWASSYYLVAILAAPMAADLGTGAPTVFAAFSVALIVSALVGPRAGRAIDRHGGRTVLMGTSVLFALGLAALGLARDPWTMFAAWALMGVAMGSGLYEAAFATLVRLYGQASRGPITGVTLIAGFASTVGWPLSAWMEARYGWRTACFGWAVLHLAIGLPLNAWLPRAAASGEGAAMPGAAVQAPAGAAVASTAPPAASTTPAASHRRHAVLLALVFAASWFVATAMASHLPRVVEAAGASLAVAVAVGALVGPAQVAGRLLEFGFLRRMHPLYAARLAILSHPVAVLTLLAGGAALAPAFGVIHGLGNGIMTIAMATLPLALFGSRDYGARLGWLMMPARGLQALAPWLFGMALDGAGVAALWLTGGLGLLGFAALMSLRPGPAG